MWCKRVRYIFVAFREYVRNEYRGAVAVSDIPLRGAVMPPGFGNRGIGGNTTGSYVVSSWGFAVADTPSIGLPPNFQSYSIMASILPS